MNTIVCPSCGEKVEITDALKHQIEDNVKNDLKAKIKKELEEKQGLELEDLKKEINEKNEKLKEFREQEIKLREEKREIEERKKDLEIEIERKLDLERKRIEEKILKEEEEKHNLKEKEKDKIIDDLRNALKDAERKASQGSQQLQGEVLELDLEKQLKSFFTFDDFLPIPKGIEGGDIWQKIKNRHGQVAGSILWEIKRTKAWSKGWLPKLREDARKVNATACILISDVLPPDVEHYDRQDGVWICSYSHAISLCKVLRDSILQIAIAKSSASHKDEKLQEIYDYIVSESFRHKIESHFESVRYLREDLETEKRAMERIWKKREVQIQRLDRSMSQMFGEIQGIAGPALPPVKGSTLELEENNETEEKENI